MIFYAISLAFWLPFSCMCALSPSLRKSDFLWAILRPVSYTFIYVGSNALLIRFCVLPSQLNSLQLIALTRKYDFLWIEELSLRMNC
jgi:hypothetical protein